ncbi:MAG: DUF6064 family protein [Thiobacillus sp.]
MSEWWIYSLRDLLLFSPRTYFRLFELHNLEWWPLPLVTLALGVALLALAWRGGDRAGRVALTLLAACWLWVAWAWHVERYAPVNWAAGYFAWAWVAQAVLMLAAAGRGRFDAPPAPRQRRLGVVLIGYALAVHPLLAPALGRAWTQAGVFGMAPDPTVLVTLGTLLAVGPRRAGWLAVIPLAWCAISGATLWALADPEFWALGLAAAFALAAFLAAGRRRATQPR